MIQAPEWYLDAFEYNSSTKMLSIKSGGYNFNSPPDHGDYGDIFIKTGPTAPLYGDTHGSTGNTVGPNSNGYDYVFDFDMASGDYLLYSIDENSQVISAYEPLNQGSSPWRYESDGVLVKTQDAVVDFTNLTLSGFDLSFLDGQEFWVHNTMQCGNDNLMGHYAPVPEPATMLLFGTGLVGLAGMARKRKQK